MTIYIYALRCPLANAIRYIGKTKNPGSRITGHLNLAKSNNKAYQYCSNWIRKLLAQGLQPSLEIIYCVPDTEDWKMAEMRLIAQYRAEGHPLTNMTAGGEGWQDMPEEVRLRMSEKLKGIYSTPERREASRARTIANFDDPVFRAKHSAGRVAALSSPEVRAKMSATAKAAAARPERKASLVACAKADWERMRATDGVVEKRNKKISKTMLDLWSDAEVKAKRLATLHTDEAKAKRYANRDTPEKTAIRVAKLKAAWADPEARAKRLAIMRSPEYKAKIAAKGKAAWSDPEAKARRAATMRTAEVRAKNSEAQKAAWRRRKLAAQQQPEPA